MYHGIIQEAKWTPRGSYLRAKIEQYQLDKIIEHGRIWRLRYDGTGRNSGHRKRSGAARRGSHPARLDAAADAATRRPRNWSRT